MNGIRWTYHTLHVLKAADPILRNAIKRTEIKRFWKVFASVPWTM